MSFVFCRVNKKRTYLYDKSLLFKKNVYKNYRSLFTKIIVIIIAVECESSHSCSVSLMTKLSPRKRDMSTDFLSNYAKLQKSALCNAFLLDYAPSRSILSAMSAINSPFVGFSLGE